MQFIICRYHYLKRYASITAGVPGVLSVRPDENFECNNKDYGGLSFGFGGFEFACHLVCCSNPRREIISSISPLFLQLGS